MTKPGRWLHGFLDLCLLALIDAKPDYGFGLAQRLTGAGFGDVPGGTLYPALLRLEQQGWVETRRVPSEAGPARKYYTLNAAGLCALERDAVGWAQFRGSVEAVVTARSSVKDQGHPGERAGGHR